MPSWFSRTSSKKVKSKLKVVPLLSSDGYTGQAQHASLASFAVVLQNFTASCSDEMCAQRGMVVEQLHIDGEWMYVKNVDGKRGFLPQSHCYPLDRMGECEMSKEEEEEEKKGTAASAKPRPLTINLEEISYTASDTIRDTCGENFPLQSTVAAIQQKDSMPSERVLQDETATDQHGKVGARRQDSMTGEAATPTSLLTTPTTGQTISAAMSTSAMSKKPPLPQPLIRPARSKDAMRLRLARPPINRANSYTEAVIEADENLYGLMAGIKPSDLRGECVRGQRPMLERVGSVGGASHVTDLVSLPDDVFVSQACKPLGIFSCLETYTPRFQGEIALRERELVMVLEQGQGEWAWVLTSDNHEGLVPKNLLHRYSVDMSALSRLSSVATQTELVINRPLCELTSSSGSYSTRGSSTGPPHSPAKPAPRMRCVEEEPSTSTAVQTESWLDVSPDWFKTIDSASSYQPSPLTSRAPTPAPPSAGRTETETAQVCKSRPLPHPLPPPRLSRGAPTSAGRQPTVCPRDRPSKPLDFDTESEALSSVSIRRQVQKTPVLTAVRDYSPPAHAKNSLALCKGDVLYIQPHMVQSSNWLWVYHSTQNSFGFVPRNSVAYMYLVQRHGRRMDSIENEV